MTASADSITEALASVGFAGPPMAPPNPPGTPVYRRQVGFVGAGPTFVPPASFDLQLTQPIGNDVTEITATGRVGFVATAERLSDTMIRVTTQDGDGPRPGAFDLIVTRQPELGTPITTLGDPVGVPFTASNEIWTPNTYVVNPTIPTPQGAFGSISAAILAAQADGFGGVAPATRAMVLVLPGTYTEDISLVPGIDVCALQQAIGYPTPGDLPSASARVIGLVTYDAPAGGDPSTTWVYWRGIDIVNPALGLNRCLDFIGADSQMLIMSECGIYQQNGGLIAVQLNNTSLTPSQLLLDRVYVTSPTLQCFFCSPGSTTQVNLHDCTVIGPLADEWGRIDGSGPWDAEYSRFQGIANILATGPAMRFRHCNSRQGLFNVSGSAVNPLLMTHHAFVMTAAVPAVAGGGLFQYEYCSAELQGGAVNPIFAATLNAGAGASESNEIYTPAGAVGVVWLATAPASFKEAVDRIALQLAIVGLGPIP